MCQPVGHPVPQKTERVRRNAGCQHQPLWGRKYSEALRGGTSGAGVTWAGKRRRHRRPCDARGTSAGIGWGGGGAAAPLRPLGPSARALGSRPAQRATLALASQGLPPQPRSSSARARGCAAAARSRLPAPAASRAPSGEPRAQPTRGAELPRAEGRGRGGASAPCDAFGQAQAASGEAGVQLDGSGASRTSLVRNPLNLCKHPSKRLHWRA